MNNDPDHPIIGKKPRANMKWLASSQAQLREVGDGRSPTAERGCVMNGARRLAQALIVEGVETELVSRRQPSCPSTTPCMATGAEARWYATNRLRTAANASGRVGCAWRPPARRPTYHRHR